MYSFQNKEKMRGLLLYIWLVSSTADALLGGIDQKHASWSLEESMSPSVEKAEDTHRQIQGNCEKETYSKPRAIIFPL